MSLASSPYASKTKWITFDRSDPNKKEVETAYVDKDVNGWNLTMDVDEEGIITMSAVEDIGRIGKGLILKKKPTYIYK
jgi:hypothetical protein